VDNQNENMLPLEPFLQDGAEAESLFDLEGAVAREDFRQFMLAQYWSGSVLNRWMFPAIGLILFVWALVGTGIVNVTGRIVLCGVGFGLMFVAFMQNRALTTSVAAYGENPLAFRYRFFEDGFEKYEDHSMARRPYSDIARIVLSGGALYLSLGKSRLYIIARASLAGRAEAVVGLLERKTGKKAVRFGGEQRK
jgi:hypothetical protein